MLTVHFNGQQIIQLASDTIGAGVVTNYSATPIFPSFPIGPFVGSMAMGMRFDPSLSFLEVQQMAAAAPTSAGQLVNPDLDPRPHSVGLTPLGWMQVNTVALSHEDHDGRRAVLRVADAGSYSDMWQQFYTTPGQQYSISADVYTDNLDDLRYWNGGLFVLSGAYQKPYVNGQSYVLAKFGPATPALHAWTSVGGLFTANSYTTTVIFHSQGAHSAWVDAIRILPEEDAGCADYTVEGTFAGNASVVACTGAWTVAGGIGPGTRTALPGCERAAGSNAARASEGCTIEDLCRDGWHVCWGRPEVSGWIGDTRITDECSALPGFFATREHGIGCSGMGGDASVGASSVDASASTHIYGCGGVQAANSSTQRNSSSYAGVSTSGDTCTPLASALTVTSLASTSTSWSTGDGATAADVRHLRKLPASSEVGGVLCCREGSNNPVPTPSPTTPTISPTPAPTVWSSYLNYTGDLSLEFELLDRNDDLADQLYRWNAALVCLAVLLTMLHFVFFYKVSCRKLFCGIGAHPERAKRRSRNIEYKSRKSNELDPDCIDGVTWATRVMIDRSCVVFRVLQRWYFHTLLRCPWLMMLVVLVPTAMTMLALIAEGMQVDAALSSVRLEGDIVTTRFEGLNAGLQYTAGALDFKLMNDSTFGVPPSSWESRRTLAEQRDGGSWKKREEGDDDLSRLEWDEAKGGVSALLGLSSRKQRWTWRWDTVVEGMAKEAAGATVPGSGDNSGDSADWGHGGVASVEERRRLGDHENMVLWMFGNEGEDMLRRDVLSLIDAFNQKVMAIDGGANPVVGASGVLALLPLLDLTGTDASIKATTTMWGFKSYDSLGNFAKDFDIETGKSRAVKLVYQVSGTSSQLTSFAGQLIALLAEEELAMAKLEVDYAYAGNSLWVAAITQALFNDMKLAGGSITFVFICLLCHTHSFLLALASVVHIIVSFPSAYFVYRVVFGIQW
jgi:hypothetical protein